MFKNDKPSFVGRRHYLLSVLSNAKKKQKKKKRYKQPKISNTKSSNTKNSIISLK